MDEIGFIPAPARIDITTATTARMFSLLLGGVDHYASDWAATARLLESMPNAVALARANQEFKGRVVRHLADRGVRQFIDLGCGLPDRRNVHTIAQSTNRTANVVYVDRDPMVLGRARTGLEENSRVAVLGADIAVDLEALFDHPRVTQLIDPQQPTAVLCLAVLHAIPDTDNPAGVLRRVAERLPGGFVAISHLVTADPQLGRQVTDLMTEVTGGRWGRARTVEEVGHLMNGLELEGPGLVDAASWHLDLQAGGEGISSRIAMVGALARLPETRASEPRHRAAAYQTEERTSAPGASWT